MRKMTACYNSENTKIQERYNQLLLFVNNPFYLQKSPKNRSFSRDRTKKCPYSRLDGLLISKAVSNTYLDRNNLIITNMANKESLDS